MTRYFKYVAIRKGKEEWMLNELKSGRARFGWSSAGSNLTIIQAKEAGQRTAEEKVVWRYTQFLVNRLTPGDRLIIQLSRPLRQFLIAEVVGNYGSTDPQEKDFNHYIECKLLTENAINVESEAVSQSLRHHISKRGHYYEIYDKDTKAELDSIVEKSLEKDDSFIKANQSQRSLDFERTSLEEAVIKQTYERISQKYPSAYFETFIADLIASIPGLEVKKQGDSKLGWDLTMRILDPIDGEELYDDIPVQCKNYQGKVTTSRPLEDLERCIKNSNSPLAYLFIMGDLSDDFQTEFDERLEELKNNYKKDVKWRIIGQEQIAKLYLNKIGSPI
ncbi:hypothetical protein [Neobacillus sp. D3-1R]|uniref:hypothetical protein n=1 Tax=Neobacillus sp. D3-1R TaxID=3445778 RepID=UPI003F9F4D2E